MPPNPGTAAWVTLEVTNGPLYCVEYANGIVTNDGDRRFSVRKPTTFGCPP